MSILDALATDFPPTIRTRGHAYQQEGRVRIVRATELGIEAHVRGTERYEVSIAWDDAGDISYGCSCPYAADTGPCKHIWATLLEAQARGIPLPSLAVLDDADVAALAPPPPSPSRRPPAWRPLLQAIGRQMAAEPARPVSSPSRSERRILYVVDIPTTISLQRGLYIEVMVETRRRDGEWGAPKTMGIGDARWDAIADPADREIAPMLLGARPEYVAWNAPFVRGAARFALPEPAFDITLPRLCDTGRCRVRYAPEDRRGAPITWDPGEPWEPRLALVPLDDGARYRVDVPLLRGDARLPSGEPRLLLRGGLVIHGGTAARLRTHDAVPLIGALAGSSGIVVRAAELPELVAELLALPHLPPVEWPPELAIEEVRPTPLPRLRLERVARHAWQPERVTGELSFTYGDLLIAPSYTGGAIYQPDARRIVHRDRAAERSAAQRLHHAGFRDEYDYITGAPRLALPDAKAHDVVLELLAEGWHVELSGHRYRAPGAQRIELRSGIDWFELDAVVEYGDRRASLPELLAALRRGDRVLTLDDGSVGVLPDQQRLRELARLAELGTPAEGRVRFAPTQVGLLDAMLATMPEATADARFARAREELRRFERIEPFDAPAGFTGELRPYQREGLGWLDFLRRFGFGGCLADDMGLGKTIQLLALLQMRKLERAGPSLVVVPRSLVFNWRREAARFTPELRVLDHSGTQRRRETEQFGDHDLILTTYGTLRRDAALFEDVEFDYVVLDEAQAIKNASTASAKAARLLRARHRLALTGTPVENHLGDLWSLFEFLNPGMLGTAAAFKRLRAGASTGTASDAAAGSGALLARTVRPFILRRTKEQVARDLPDKLEQTVYVDLEPGERKLYDQLRDHYRATLLARVSRVGIAKSKMQVLEALLRLRQAACHPGLLDKARTNASSSKLGALIPQLVEVIEGGHKALVFSQFTSLLAILRARLDAEGVTYEYLDGHTRDRERRVARFQGDAACPLFLISLKAGGVGLNLTAADYVFLLDPWWNPATEAQAIDRAHRIGQKRRVFASRLIARDTVEERVLELQDAKRDLADAIVGEDSGVIARIGREELEALLR